MPSKYRIRNYAQNSTYHISNLGLGGAEVFADSEDYQKFIDYLESSITQDLKLLAYLLLPTHFHILLAPLTSPISPKDSPALTIPNLLKKLTNSYTYYYQKKYSHSGPVFAGRYKSILIPPTFPTLQTSPTSLLSQYLYSHPNILWLADSYKAYPWSKISPEISFEKKELDKKTILEIKDLLID